VAKKHRQQNPAGPGNEPESATETAWALAATRETVISHLYSLPHNSSSEVDQAARQLSLRPAMTYRWLARYRRDPHVSRSCDAKGSIGENRRHHGSPGTFD